MVAGFEIESYRAAGPLDVRSTRTFHHAVDRAIGLAPALAVEARRQALQEGLQGGHGGAAGQRVDVAQLVAVTGVDRRAAFELVQGLAAALVGVAEDGRGGTERRVAAHRRHVVP